MFKSLSEKVATGPCPYCSYDSFVYEHNDKKMFLCHHCQRHIQHEKVNFDVQHNANNVVDICTSTRININYSSVLRNCTIVSDLHSDHECLSYVRNRKIPASAWSDLYYCEDFRVLAAAANQQVAKSRRLVLPFFNQKGELFGLQGRSLDGDEPRYITIIYDTEEEKLFGTHKVDLTKPFFCVEGPIDSLFLKNCIAMAGSDGLSDKYKTSGIMCFDNEPRNTQIVAKLERYVNDGFKVVIWPDSIKQKDINDMVNQGVDVQHIVEQNTFCGLAAKIKFNSWKRV
jgi:hypothetical protein